MILCQQIDAINFLDDTKSAINHNITRYKFVCKNNVSRARLSIDKVVFLTLTALNPPISSFQEGFRRIEVTRDMKWRRI